MPGIKSALSYYNRIMASSGPDPAKTAMPATSRHEGRPLDAASTPTPSLANLPSSCRSKLSFFRGSIVKIYRRWIIERTYLKIVEFQLKLSDYIILKCVKVV